MSGPFYKNVNSVFPILIEKNYEQKNYFCPLKMRSIIFLKKRNPIFWIKLEYRLTESLSLFHVKNSRFLLSYFLKKDDLPKATDSTLPRVRQSSKLSVKSKLSSIRNGYMQTPGPRRETIFKDALYSQPKVRFSNNSEYFSMGKQSEQYQPFEKYQETFILYNNNAKILLTN